MAKKKKKKKNYHAQFHLSLNQLTYSQTTSFELII